MSAGAAIPREQALRVAQTVLEYLAEGAVQLAVAGSIRRERPEVHDIEVVAEPRLVMRAGDDLWASEHEEDMLEQRVQEAISRRIFVPRQVENHRAGGETEFQTKLGPKFKALMVADLPLDLFIVRPPASWAVIYALRTGPGAWNTRLVTECQAIGRRVRDGQVQRWDGNRWVVVPTPDERSFFAALGQRWLEPRDRSVERVEIRRPTERSTP